MELARVYGVGMVKPVSDAQLVKEVKGRGHINDEYHYFMPPGCPYDCLIAVILGEPVYPFCF